MFESTDVWLVGARAKMSKYAAHRRLIEDMEAESARLLAEVVRRLIGDMEAESARLLAEVVDAYQWPEERETLPTGCVRGRNDQRPGAIHDLE